MNLQERWRGYALASLALLLAVAPLSLLLTLFAEGFSHLDWIFFSTAPEQAGRSGGIGPIILSTLWVLLICLAIAVPLGLGTALFLVEQLRPDSRANLAHTPASTRGRCSALTKARWRTTRNRLLGALQEHYRTTSGKRPLNSLRCQEYRPWRYRHKGRPPTVNGRGQHIGLPLSLL